MSRLWSWLRRDRAVSRPTGAPPRSSARTPLAPRARISFDTLEDRLAPSVSALSQDDWRNETFHVDDAVVASISGPTVQAAGTNYANQSFGSLIGLDQVYASSYHGAGYSVAVIDTGIDYTHPDLGGGWGKRVVAGWDFVNNDANPMDDNGHGTHVAGIIGSSSTSYAGVAPEANLIGLKVLGADGSGSFGAVEDALKWVIANRTKYNIVSINLSLGSGNYNVNPYAFLDDEFAALKNAGVFIAVAAGNSYYSYQSQAGLAYPGVSPNVVSVGAVWDSNFGAVAWASGARDNSTAADRVASFSQRSSNLSILAPGAMITSTYLGGKYQSMAGTSMASPVIAGAAAILHQALDAAGKSNLATEDGILSIMKSTGVRVVDGDDENDNVVNTGLAFQRINMAAALQAVGSAPTQPQQPSNSAPTLATIANQSIAAGGTFTIGLSATDPNGDAIVYSARIVGQGAAGSAQAYELKQSLGLYNLGTYYANAFGMNEKWLGGSNGVFYTLLPSGQLRRWAGTADATKAAANLVATLDVSYYGDPSLLINAQPAAASPLSTSVSGNQLTVSAAASATGSYQVEVSASDGKLTSSKAFTVTIGAANRAPVWTTIADQKMSGTKPLAVTLNAIDPDGGTLTYTARVTNASGVGAAVKGKVLTLTNAAGYSGAFTVEVTASDGVLSSTTSFRVVVSNTAPTLTIAAKATAGAGATRVAIPLSASDADGDAVTFKAETTTSDTSSIAYRLKTTYTLSYAGDYFTNVYRLGEKWLKSSDGLQFFCILPNGELHKFSGSVADLTNASTLIARLDSSYYNDPSKLWNAVPSAAAATVSVVNNQLIVTLAQPFRGSISVKVTVSDGLASVTKTIVVSFP
jgi:subtilisin family serine protease